MEILSEAQWKSLREAHEKRVKPWIAPRLRRSSLGERHPVEDFLFEYYAYRPGQLLRWHPGIGRGLAGEAAREYLEVRGYGEADGVVRVEQLPPQRERFVRWLKGFLTATQERAGVFGCFGLHEWAMVYRAEEIRHAAWPLRLTAEAIAEAVETLGLRCTHYDAFRFFTPCAAPLNKTALRRETSIDFEQPGCLHANMDLYKWAFKLAPFTSSELVADAFELAREIRELDMRASPYDLRALGYEPVRVETAEGRAEYEEAQREHARRAEPLRRRLIAVCEQLCATVAEEV